MRTTFISATVLMALIYSPAGGQDTATSRGSEASGGDGNKIAQLKIGVIDDKGKVVPGAEVNIFRPSGRGSYLGIGKHALTDEKGTTAFTLEPGEYLASASAHGYAYSLGQPVTAERGKTATVKLSLVMLPRMIGVVRDADGLPVSDAIIRIGSRGLVSADGDAKSDANGRFELPYAWGPKSEKPQFIILARNAKSGLARLIDVEDPNRPIEIALKPGAVLTGLVVGEDGKPLAMANVSTKYEGLSLSRAMEADTDFMEANTDAKGRYRINNMFPGEITLTARVDGFGPGVAHVKVEDGKKEIEVEDFALKAASLTITGIIKDPNGQPMDKVEIIAFIGGTTIHPEHFTTDKSGHFTITKLPEGKVFIQAMAGEFHGTAQAKAGDKNVQIVMQEGTKGSSNRP